MLKQTHPGAGTYFRYQLQGMFLNLIFLVTPSPLAGLQTEVMPRERFLMPYSCLSAGETPQLSQPLPSLDHMHIS